LSCVNDILATVIAVFRWRLQGNECGAVRLGSAGHGTENISASKFDFQIWAVSIQKMTRFSLPFSLRPLLVACLEFYSPGFIV
jgi:hypothetical protein